MKYYKSTDSQGNVWACSRSNPNRVVNHFGLLNYHPWLTWTANQPKTKYRYDTEVIEVHPVVEIDAKEYRSIMKNREAQIDQLWHDYRHAEQVKKLGCNLPENTEEDDDSNSDDNYFSQYGWIDDLAEKQFSEEKITIRLTLEQLSKLTIHTSNWSLYGDSRYDPVVSEGVMDMLNKRKHQTIIKQMAFRDFCEMCAEQVGTRSVEEAKRLLKASERNKKIYAEFIEIHKNSLAAN